MRFQYENTFVGNGLSLLCLVEHSDTHVSIPRHVVTHEYGSGYDAIVEYSKNRISEWYRIYPGIIMTSNITCLKNETHLSIIACSHSRILLNWGNDF